MALELILKGVNNEYKGPRRFAHKDTANKEDPTTPKIPAAIIQIQDLPNRVTDIEAWGPFQIAQPIASVVDRRDLFLSSGRVGNVPRPGVPYGIDVSIEVTSTGITVASLITGTKPSSLSLAIEEIGRINDDRKRGWVGFIWEGERRFRALMVLGDIEVARTGPSEALEFTRRHYSYQLDPKPLKP